MCTCCLHYYIIMYINKALNFPDLHNMYFVKIVPLNFTMCSNVQYTFGTGGSVTQEPS